MAPKSEEVIPLTPSLKVVGVKEDGVGDEAQKFRNKGHSHGDSIEKKVVPSGQRVMALV